MADQKVLDLIASGRAQWNWWREANFRTCPDLQSADLQDVDLRGAILCDVDFRGAKLRRTRLSFANLRGAKLDDADLTDAILSQADLSAVTACNANFTSADMSGAILTAGEFSGACFLDTDLTTISAGGATFSRASFHRANLWGASLSSARLDNASLPEANMGGTNFSGADLSHADLSGAKLHAADFRRAVLRNAIIRAADLKDAQLHDTDLQDAIIENCNVDGISAWNVKLHSAVQSHLVITPASGITVEVQSLEFAHLLHLLWHNESFRGLIDSTADRGVLLLGSFEGLQMHTLDVAKGCLKKLGYIPIVFNFKPSETRDLHETIVSIGSLVKFIVADLTAAHSVAQELGALIPCLPSVPVLPLLKTGCTVYGLFEHLLRFRNVLPISEYGDDSSLSCAIETGARLLESLSTELKTQLLQARAALAGYRAN